MFFVNHKFGFAIGVMCFAFMAQTVVAANEPVNNTALAQTIPVDHSSPLFISLSGGPLWVNAGQDQNQSFTIQSDVLKEYAFTNQSQVIAFGELFVGVQRNMYALFQEGQFGFAIATASNLNLTGHIWDDADPSFNNYNFKYQIRHTSVSVKGKLLMDTSFHDIKPYLSGSIGLGFNYASNFSSTPTVPEAMATPNFSSNMTTTMTYAVGAGLERQLSKHWQAGVGYEFSDWGRSQLGCAPGQTSGDRVTLNHMYTHTLLFNLTWLA